MWKRHAIAMNHLVFSLLLAACGPEEAATNMSLELDGPARVRVDQLGPVVGPRVLLEDGSEPQVDWALSPEGVASIQDGAIVAVAPGEVQVTASYAGHEVSWVLIVDPAMVMQIRGAPPELSVGDTLVLEASARVGDTEVDPGAVGWSSSDPELLQVAADGSATALGIGRVWVTARSRTGAQSMVEIDVK